MRLSVRSADWVVHKLLWNYTQKNITSIEIIVFNGALFTLYIIQYLITKTRKGEYFYDSEKENPQSLR